MRKTNLSENFGTLSETLNALLKLGYTHDFNIHEECLICHKTNTILQPEDFQIDKVYRFEGASNPEDQSILYAISSPKLGIMGTLVNGYGISSDEQSSKLIEKLRTNDTILQPPKVSKSVDGALVEMNLHSLMVQLKNEKTWIEGDRGSVVIFKSDTMRIVLMGLHENAVLKSHKANGVISVQVLEGKVNFITEQQQALLEKGQMIALQENIVHSVTALKESFFLLSLSMNKTH